MRVEICELSCIAIRNRVESLYSKIPSDPTFIQLLGAKLEVSVVFSIINRRGDSKIFVRGVGYSSRVLLMELFFLMIENVVVF